MDNLFQIGTLIALVAAVWYAFKAHRDAAEAHRRLNYMCVNGTAIHAQIMSAVFLVHAALNRTFTDEEQDRYYIDAHRLIEPWHSDIAMLRQGGTEAVRDLVMKSLRAGPFKEYTYHD